MLHLPSCVASPRLVIFAAGLALFGCSSGNIGSAVGGGATTHSGGSGAGAQAGSAGSTGTTATGGNGTGGATSSEPCAGVTCNGQGTCSAQGGVATCACNPGYHAVGATCVVDEQCMPGQCGTCAACEVIGGVATCTCPQDYMLQGNECVLAIDPCANAGCTAEEACVPEAHCQALGACVPLCDCSNCPNCGPDNSDGKWNDWQEYCGAAPDQSPATMACNKPCPQGQGCLPYQVQFCWPIEGCFSL
ncbi:MAG: hypothetical protein U0441_07400 [Polyangiaceae bacterium]